MNTLTQKMPNLRQQYAPDKQRLFCILVFACPLPHCPREGIGREIEEQNKSHARLYSLPKYITTFSIILSRL